jgi:hypothetical protein
MANEIHALNVGNTSYTIQPRVIGPMSTYSNGVPCPSVSGVIRYDTAIGNNPFGSGKSDGMNNAVLSISRGAQSDTYTTQLGFSRYGIYGRWFYDKTPDTTTPWRRFIMDDGVDTLNIDTPNVNVDASSISLEATNINIGDGISTLCCTKLKLSNSLSLTGGNEELEYIYTGLQMPVSIKPLTLSYNSVTYPVYVHLGEGTDGNLEREVLFNMCTDSVNLQSYPSSKTYHVWVAKSQYEQLMHAVNSATLDHLTTYNLVFTKSSTPELYEDSSISYGMTVAGRGSYVWINNMWDDLGVWAYTDFFLHSGFVESNKWIIDAYEIAEACAVMTSTGYDSNGVMDGITDINIESKDVCTINSNDVNINCETDINIESREKCSIISSGDVNINGRYIGIGSNTSYCETIEIGTLGEQDVFINGREITIYGGACYTNNTLHAAFIEAQSSTVSTIGRDTPFVAMFTEQGFYQSSDERLKTFGDNIKVDFDALSKLRKAYFTWNDNPDTTHIGVSAQEIKEIYPEIVSGDDRLTVDYTKLSVIALAAVDELHKKNVELEERLAKLEALLLK